MTHPLLQYSPETEVYVAAAPPQPAPRRGGGPAGVVFGDDAALELATALLEARGGARLERVLDELLARAGRRLGAFVRTPVAAALRRLLGDVARTSLAGGAAVATAAARRFGLELEGLSPEDRDYELARRFVGLAGAALARAAAAPADAPAAALARNALAGAARHHAPGLLPELAATSGGRWVRRGRVIVVFDG